MSICKNKFHEMHTISPSANINSRKNLLSTIWVPD